MCTLAAKTIKDNVMEQNEKRVKKKKIIQPVKSATPEYDNLSILVDFPAVQMLSWVTSLKIVFI